MTNTNLIEDILDIIKDDNRHNAKICIDSLGVTIYLDDDPEDAYEEKYVIPIRYDALLECCYIPQHEYIQCMSDETESGIDREQINLIQRIMTYLENHKEVIQKYSNILSHALRHMDS